MAARVGPDDPPGRPQRLAPGDEDVLQLGQVGKRAVRHRFVDERPDPFDRLQLRGGRGQADKVDSLGHRQLWARVPARPIQDEDRPMGGVDPFVPRRGGQGRPIAAVLTVGSRHHPL